MIDELRARDVALIRDAVIEPAPGLTVLTGIPLIFATSRLL